MFLHACPAGRRHVYSGQPVKNVCDRLPSLQAALERHAAAVEAERAAAAAAAEQGGEEDDADGAEQRDAAPTSALAP